MKTRIASNYSLWSEEACSTVSASAGNVPEIQTLGPYRRPVEHQEQGAAARSDSASRLHSWQTPECKSLEEP